MYIRICSSPKISSAANHIYKSICFANGAASQLIFYFMLVCFVHEKEIFVLCVQAPTHGNLFFMSELMYKSAYIT